MEPILFLYAFLLGYSSEIQGSSAETPVFVKKGNDVTLNVTRAHFTEVVVFTWRFKQKTSLVTFVPGAKLTVSPNYTGRIEFSKENHSMKLKNLQQTDSGDYSARIIDAVQESTVAEYRVTVQDPVSPVELKVDSVSTSSDSCNLTVTCRTQDSNISSTFTCYKKTCNQEGGERSEVTTSGASLHVYLRSDSIICNHSNQVSWTQNTTEIQRFCPRHDDGNEKPLTSAAVVAPAVSIPVILVIAAILGLIFYFHRKRGKSDKTENMENTVYETPQVHNTSPQQDLSQTDDPSGLSPTSTYSLVGPHTGYAETRSLPESVYAQVQKPSRS